MFVDSRAMPSGEVIQSEVCVVGTGPAGVTLAREWMRQGFRVCLLESGGIAPDSAAQTLSEGVAPPRHANPRYDLGESRVRRFGGTANIWNIEVEPSGQAPEGSLAAQGDQRHHGRHVIPAEGDFERREWLPYSGWPVSRSELEPFYMRAQAVCKLGPPLYDGTAWETPQAPQLRFPGGRVTTTMYQLGPRAAFSHEYRAEIERADTITTYLYATVLEIVVDNTSGAVSHLRVGGLPGQEFTVHAKVFVLAAGGVENARLLLLSGASQQVALGNQHDLVGRFFMDHVVAFPGVVLPFDPQLFNAMALYDLRRERGVGVMGTLTLSPEVREQEQLLGACATLSPKPKGYSSEAVRSFKALISRPRELATSAAVKRVSNAWSGVSDIASFAYGRTLQRAGAFDANHGGWSLQAHNERRFGVFHVGVQVEQAPDPENRVTLSAEVDALGQRQAQLEARPRERDLDSIRRTIDILAAELAGARVGQYQPLVDLSGTVEPPFFSSHHHLGTTRMHRAETSGVVNEDCRVHGISNLFIAGSSIFPTGGGYANPTLTLVALALRLADHVKTRLTRPATSLSLP